MRKYFILATLLLIAAACNKPSATVNLDLKEGVATNIELYRLDFNRLSFVDSLATDKDGHLRYALHYPNDKFHEHPMFIDLTVIKQII